VAMLSGVFCLAGRVQLPTAELGPFLMEMASDDLERRVCFKRSHAAPEGAQAGPKVRN
jgi:hypothetical protein